MAVYPKGNRFMGSVGTGPERSRKTFKTEAKAVEWVQLEEANRAAIKALPVVPKKPKVWTLQQAYDHCRQHHWVGNKGGNRKAEINAGFALAFFGPDTPISEITPQRVIDYMRELMDEYENSPATLNKKMSCLKVILTCALDLGGISTVPRMTRYTEDTRSPHWYSDAEEEAMLAMCRKLKYPELEAFIIVGMDTGFRRGEILGLRMADYHQGSLLIHADSTKTKTARTVPVKTQRLRDLLESRMGRQKVLNLTNAELRRQWVELRGALGRNEDPFFIPHTMRHTCATRLVSAGAPLKAVQMWLGHGVIESTMVYAHLAPGQLEDAGRKLAERGTGPTVLL